MAYNLPPAWDAGYALPSNVRDEGLQRRAFVTKQMPRGTYDAPAVNTGGYAVPQYVMDEGYGQGTYTTKWAPSGTYGGPRVANWLNRRPQLVDDRRLAAGGQQLTFRRQNMQALGGIAGGPMPQAFQTYGNRAATVLLTRMNQLPANRRSAALKATLDKVDPTLYGRAKKLAEQYNRQGMPVSQAVHQGLANAMSSGIAAEIVNTGLRRSAPQANSLLGLGCYGGKAALGADFQVQATSALPSGVIGTYQTPQSCAAPAGYKWDVASGSWVRLKVGEAPQTSGAPCGPGGQTVVPVVSDKRHQLVLVGPFSMPADVKDISKPFVLTTTDRIPDTWKTFIHDTILKGAGNGKQLRPGAYAHVRKPGETWLDIATWLEALGIPAGTVVGTEFFAPESAADLSWRPGGGNAYPVARFKHPVTGDDWGVYFAFRRKTIGEGSPNASAANPQYLQIYYAKIPKEPWYEVVGDWLVWLPAQLGDAIADALDELGDLACQLLNGTGAQIAGAAAAAAAGAPPQAGAAGASLAYSQCGQPPPPVIQAPKSNILTVALLAGGAVVLVALATKKKKAPTP